jgi:hypothetical protein
MTLRQQTKIIKGSETPITKSKQQKVEPMLSQAISKETSLLNTALMLASKGFHLFPLLPGLKIPPKDMKFKELATRNLLQIEKWWAENPRYNIGIYCEKFGESESLVVIDIDKKNGRDGFLDIEKLKSLGHKFPSTYFQTTPSGGMHLIYRVKKAVKGGTSVESLGEGIDIKSRGGYVVGPNSVLSEYCFKAYVLDTNSPIAEAPLWLVSLLKTAKVKKEVDNILKLPPINIARAVKRGVAYLATIPTATIGSRDMTCFKVACRLRDFGVDKDNCLSLMWDKWKCEPMIEFDKFTHQIDSAYKYAANDYAVDAPEVLLSKIEKEIVDPVTGEIRESDFIDELNTEYALVKAGDGVHIIRETQNNKGHDKIEHITITAFYQMFANKTVPIQGKKKDIEFVSKAKLWFKDSKRREYLGGLVFSPGKEPKADEYNLFRGFPYKPFV